MKIIDEKGRLFGKINIIDFLVILFLVAITPMFYFGYRVLHRPPPVTEAKPSVDIDIDIYVILKNLNPQVASLISARDKEFNSSGQVIGEILEVVRVEPNFVTIKLSEAEVITKEDAQRKQVTVKIRIRGGVAGSDILYKGNSLKIGSNISFKTAEYEVEGILIPELIIQAEKIAKPGFNPITLDVLLRNINPEVTNLISVGDSEVDKDGDTIAKVINVGTIEPYAYKIDLGSGNYITRTDPQKKQLQVKMEIMGGVEGSAFYFRGRRIALDSEIEFNTNKYKVEGLITREPVPVKRLDKKWLLLKVRFTNLLPELVDVIKEGDEEIDNISGNLLTKVIKIESVTESMVSKAVILDNNKELSIVNNPFNKDVVLLIKTVCAKEQKGLFFKEIPVKIGNSIFLQTTKYDIYGQILRIEEISD